MKLVNFLIFVALVCYIIAVGYNVTTIHNLDEKSIEKNKVSLTIEMASRLGIGQTFGIIGDLLNTNDAASVLQDGRVRREFVNVLFDWYAPIKWSPILNVSKEAGFMPTLS
jgi:hypothetical protein